MKVNTRIIAEQIFLEAVKSVLPDKLIQEKLSLNEDSLAIGHLNFSLKSIDNIYVIGAGKASAMMAAEVEKILYGKIREGHIVVKYGYACKLKSVKVTEAGHPVPDSHGCKASLSILNIAKKAKANDLLICLLSGGGSALLADYHEGSSIEELIIINSLLINSGACIQEINAVRKHLSVIKGGQLARAVYPATLVSLILSDVAGDPIDVIASGPTAPDPTTYSQALSVLEKFNLTTKVSRNTIEWLQEGVKGNLAETPKPGDKVFMNVTNLLIGTNRLALEAAKLKAMEFNINAVIIDDQLQGDYKSVAEYIVETSIKFQDDKSEVKPVALLFGGETTVKMTGKGSGGRNQHFALLCALLLRGHPRITILSAGTDGNDGPTDAAGAVVDSETSSNALRKHIDPVKYLDGFDSFHFFKKAGGHVITGPTRTNVMDIIVAIVE